MSSAFGGNAVPFRPSALRAMATAWSCVSVAEPAGWGVLPMLLAQGGSTAATIARPVGYAFIIWGSVLYVWSGLLYVAQVVIAVRRSGPVG